MCSSHSMKYSAIKRNEVLTHEWTLKTLCWEKRDIKDGYCMVLFIWNSRLGKSYETESRLVVPRAERIGKKWGVTANGFEVSFWGDENVLKLWWWRHKSVNILETTACIYFKWVNCIVCELYHNKAATRKPHTSVWDKHINGRVRDDFKPSSQ